MDEKNVAQRASYNIDAIVARRTCVACEELHFRLSFLPREKIRPSVKTICLTARDKSPTFRDPNAGRRRETPRGNSLAGDNLFGNSGRICFVSTRGHAVR